MSLKYALLLTRGGLPITSFDFASGGINVDEVLFSGLVSAIQSFVDEISDAENKSRIGILKNDNLDILYWKGTSCVGVLIGNDFDNAYNEKLTWIMSTIAPMVQNNLSMIDSACDKTNGIVESFKQLLVNAFTEQSIHEYLTPKFHDGIHSSSIDEKKNLGEQYQVFIDVLDGKRTLFEIKEITDLSWTEVQMISSELVSGNLISFKVDFNDEQIFKMTDHGLDTMFGRDAIPADLQSIWDPVILPFLSLVDGERPLKQINERIKKKIDKEEFKFLNKYISDLLYQRIIEPLPTLFQLGMFMQKYYLEFYSYLRKKVGKTGERIFLENMDNKTHVKVLLPDFQNMKYQSIDKIYHLMKASSKQQNQSFIKNYASVITETLDALKQFIGSKSVKKINHKIWETLEQENKLLIEEYQLDEVFYTTH